MDEAGEVGKLLVVNGGDCEAPDPEQTKNPVADTAAQVTRFELFERNVRTEPMVPMEQGLMTLADELEAQADLIKSEISENSSLQMTVIDLCYYAGWLRGNFR